MIYQNNRLLLIAGPCSLESWETCEKVAGELSLLQMAFPELLIVFKGSYDKANRTSLESDRGPGMKAGLEWLAEIHRLHRFPVTTDIHTPDQITPVAEVCHILQIPAFLCRQTDLLCAAAETGKVVNVKKGQFLSPFEMEFVVKKLWKANAKEVWQTDRGTTFGYQNLVVDMRSFPIMASFSTPTICDATHAVQLPGAGGGKSGGQREFIPVIARAAIAAGASGLFMETHPDPANAISDAASQIPLESLSSVIAPCVAIWKAMRALPAVPALV
jgi:2-dehydro-3-deoxyphosphooctonate aldolase (KDO 8-P synthase)